jgi:hypothetical protein
MPPSGTRASNPGKASYKTYEAQARLVRAMVAAHPETRWNYKGKLITFQLEVWVCFSLYICFSSQSFVPLRPVA